MSSWAVWSVVLMVLCAVAGLCAVVSALMVGWLWLAILGLVSLLCGLLAAVCAVLSLRELA